MQDSKTAKTREFPTIAGILLGLGLGGFFDGIVLHQVLQWHHMVSMWYPIDSIDNLQLNILWDGFFHSATYLFVIGGLISLWRTSHKNHLYWSSKLLWGTVLLGFGTFNCVEGVVDHHLLGIHHVNEQVPMNQRLIWDIGFLVWGAVMVAAGWLLWRSGRTELHARAESGTSTGFR